MKSKEIIYPIFLECYSTIKDIFWETIFKDLAYGSPPFGTYISKDFLCCGFKNKEFSYKIDSQKNPQILFQEIYNLLKNKLCISSSQDKILEKMNIESIEGNIKQSRQLWCNIRKKNVKELLIEKFVIDNKKKYNLTIHQARFLLSIIYISIMFKVIKIKNINYSNGKIINMDNFDFSEKIIYIKKNIYNCNEPVDDDSITFPLVDTDSILENEVENDTFTIITENAHVKQREKHLIQTKWSKFIKSI